MPGEDVPSQLRQGGQLNLGILKQMYGDLVLQIVALQSENSSLRQQVVELGRKVPPEDPDKKPPEDPKKPDDPKGDTKPN